MGPPFLVKVAPILIRGKSKITCASQVVTIMLVYNETPVQELQEPIASVAGVRLLVKREDLNHPQVSGNKWWKLKYNLQKITAQGKDTVLTFGGAYSNHIYATSVAAEACGLKSIGLIRGEERLPLNPTLNAARKFGMTLQYISREEYRKKTDEAFLSWVKEKWNDPYLLPEGGTNALGVRGAREFGLGLHSTAFDYLCVPVGTGGTIAGLIQATGDRAEILGFPAIRGEGSLASDITRLSGEINQFARWRLERSYHHGGYAKTTHELIAFIEQFERAHGFPLDAVYTGKMMFGIFDLLRRGYFSRGSTVLAIHTGGLSGRQ